MRLVTFLDHPLGESNGADAIKRADNISNFYQWMNFLTTFTGLVLEVSWMAYATAGLPRPRHYVDTLKIIERCDLYVSCGGVHNPHMLDNMKAARRCGVPIVDLSKYGVLPPELDENIAQVITAQISRTVGKSIRRIWMPLLTPHNVDELIKLRHAVDLYLPTEHQNGVAILDRIIAAASEHEA